MIRKKITSAFAGMQLKDFLYEELSLSNNLVKKAKSETGQILINGEKKTVRYELRAGDLLQVIFPPEKVSNRFVKSNVPLKVLYEDNDVIVIDKQAGIPTIPSRLYPDHTIANGLLAYYEKIDLRSTIHVVTRLDRDTSGVLLVAKHQYSHSILSRYQKQFLLRRKYVAVVHGKLERNSGTINAPIGRKEGSIIEREVTRSGRQAITHFEVVDRLDDVTIVEVKLETGRTHQIRVHFSHIGHPLIGDGLYGMKSEKSEFYRTALHCSKISFPHPFTEKTIIVRAPFHQDMSVFLERKFL